MERMFSKKTGMYYDKLKLRFRGVFCFFGVLGGGRMKQVLNRILFFILVSTFVFLETSTQSVATDFSDYDLVSYRVDENYPPLTYTKNMRIYGFDPDFTNLIFNQMDYKIEMSSGNWTEIYESLVEGNIDIAGIIAVTDKRENEVLFTNPLFESGVSVYTRENYEKIQLEDLKNLNVGVGKGYSSLNNLQLLPISTVKIDKSFIDQILRRDEKSLILEEIISIAHKLKMNVIAEGVEEEQQMEYLKSKSCDYIQGYYYSKPLPKEEMEKILQTEERVKLI